MVACSVRVTVFRLVPTIERCVIRRFLVHTVAIAVTTVLALLPLLLVAGGGLCGLHCLQDLEHL